VDVDVDTEDVDTEGSLGGIRALQKLITPWNINQLSPHFVPGLPTLLNM
jgi:hypothetical protein